MKKAFVAGLLMCAMVSAYADTFELYWRTWAFDHSASDLEITGDDDTGILNNYDVLWQLIHSESGVPAAPDLTAPYFLGEGDSLLDDRSFSMGSGGMWNLSLYADSEDPSAFPVDKDASHFYVYQRIYELEPGTTAPVEGSWYFDSAVEDLATWQEWGAGTPAALYALGDDEQTMGVKPTQQVPMTQPIPEPATMSLLGLGALVLGLRRKLRK